VNELSLFTGAGGGVLGTHLLGWRPIGYVEWDDYCQRVLAARIADGCLPVAPIFSDVREFVQSGAAREYLGFADVVSAGFPCQPHSVCGKRRGADDERDMWPATADVIRLVRPSFVWLENVTGLLSGYLGVVLADLAEMGYRVKWGCLRASEFGAFHHRDRIWILADADCGDAKRIELGSPHSRQRPQQEERSTGLRDRGRWKEWPAEPRVGRVVPRLAHRVDRIAALGNGQVPRVVAAAWDLLS
jgi:DNA (cytosine-5)-methyltransferase 1